MPIKTKIIATLGPSSLESGVLRAMIDAGTNIIRLNLSHSTPDQIGELFEAVRAVDPEIPIMADLQGAKIRILTHENGLTIQKGKDYTLKYTPDNIDEDSFSLTYPDIYSICKKGAQLAIDDGKFMMIMKEVTHTHTVVEAQSVGHIMQRKGVHVIGVDVPFPLLSEKDKKDIVIAVENGTNFIAASMIRSAKEVYAIRGMLPEHVGVVVKIEHPKALENIEEIADAADYLLVARGDMGVQLPLAQVPIAQKRILQVGRAKGKPVIVATQLLDSMIHNLRPTRAEVSDVASAVYDAADALLLTGETTIGDHPVECIAMLRDIARAVEQNVDYVHLVRTFRFDQNNQSESISYAAVEAAHSFGAHAIVCFTVSGSTAFRIAKFRPAMPIFAFTPSKETAAQLKGVFGVKVFVEPMFNDTESMIARAKSLLKERNVVREGECFVVTAGLPLAMKGKTNMIRIETIE